MTTVTLDTEFMQQLKDYGIHDVADCFNCGSCVGACPLSGMESGFPRRLIRRAQLGLTDFEDGATWACATCNACVQQCPRDVKILALMKSLRKIVITTGAGYMPKSLHQAMLNITTVGNPFGEPAEKRGSWAIDKGVPIFTADMELLLFLGCFAGYDPLVRKTASAVVDVLKKAGIPFGILGSEECCCGESVNKSGNEELFNKLAARNIETFQKHGIKRILTISPHCYSTFKEEYPLLGGEFEVLHYTEYFAKLIKEGRIRLSRNIDSKVTYHDPCHLGRYNSIYNEPRELLRSIPGLELVEMPFTQGNSLCCGGGGGGIWREIEKEKRLSDKRLDQASKTGANTLAVACPFCKVNLEGSNMTSSQECVDVKDIAELILEAI
ncbi:MAG: (Fe-S)-binding protein [Chloroflexota bacterium]|nr:(Fe-S)-binding protein [Chloroflexota bacterium]